MGTARKPLVLNDSGRTEQIQSGDTLDVAMTGAQEYGITNGNAGAIVIGTPVYKTAVAGTVDKARANAISTAEVFGLVKDASIANGATGNVVLDGPLVATTGQWDTITGASGGLTHGSWYFLDPATAGKLTTSVTTTVGEVVTKVGIAISTTVMRVNIGEAILR